MCFYHGDYDWYADVQKETIEVASKDLRCDECHCTIAAGQEHRQIYQQEHEECCRCEEGECECEEGRCCQCAPPDFGNDYTYRRCLDCEKFLECVQMAEEEAGCLGRESRPTLGGMTEEIHYVGAHEAKRYVRKVKEHYPELLSGKGCYVAKLWRLLF